MADLPDLQEFLGLRWEETAPARFKATKRIAYAKSSRIGTICAITFTVVWNGNTSSMNVEMDASVRFQVVHLRIAIHKHIRSENFTCT